MKGKTEGQTLVLSGNHHIRVDSTVPPLTTASTIKRSIVRGEWALGGLGGGINLEESGGGEGLEEVIDLFSLSSSEWISSSLASLMEFESLPALLLWLRSLNRPWRR